MSENNASTYRFDRLEWLKKTGYLQRSTLFLDLNHWIGLSDKQDDIYRELSDALHDAVDTEKVICPVSPSLLMEVEKRPRDDRRGRYCRLMNRLSGGLSLRIHPATFAEEFRLVASGQRITRQIAYSYFFEAMSSGSSLKFPAGWTKESAVKAAELIFEEVTSMSILQAVNMMADEKRDQSIGYLRSGWSRLAREAGEWREQNEAVSAANIEQAEFASTVKSLVPQIVPFLLEAGPSMLMQHVQTSEDEKREMLEACPTFWCRYKLLGAVRAHKKTLKENDLWDLEHVATAAPYVDCLACDRGTRHLCTQLVRLNDKFATQIVSKPNEILSWIRNQSAPE